MNLARGRMRVSETRTPWSAGESPDQGVCLAILRVEPRGFEPLTPTLPE
jgi:hypothetical protein